jgi:A/G-specific adenine glycosylase
MKHTLLQRALLRWYRTNRRRLPWRQSRNPYRILVSEIMLQQTQVQTVIPYYRRFLENFPDLPQLARAPLSKVLKLWEGLGYYSRARNLHALAKEVMRRFRGRLPSNGRELRALPGIGRYTAGAILSIAFHQDVPVVDGNVQRVLARLYGLRGNLHSVCGQRRLWALAELLLPRGHAGDHNQALMDLGATICTSTSPQCNRCPLRATCRALKMNLVHQIPAKKRKRPLPHFHIGVGVIWRKKKILIAQRPLEGLLGGLWEFPGGRKEPRESLARCVRRETEEELGVMVKVGPKLAEVDHAYSHFKITLHAYHCRYLSGVPKPRGCRAWRWVSPPELTKLAFPAANQPVIRQLLQVSPYR